MKEAVQAPPSPVSPEALCPVPDPFRSEDQHDRFYHLDLPTLTIADLERELTVVQLVVWLGGEPWHGERETVIRAELELRRSK